MVEGFLYIYIYILLNEICFIQWFLLKSLLQLYSNLYVPSSHYVMTYLSSHILTCWNTTGGMEWPATAMS